MKRFILLTLALFIAVFSFGQSADVVVDPAIFEQLYNLLIAFVPPQILVTVSLSAYILDNLITYSKFTPANSVVEFVWIWGKKIVHFLAGKRK